MTNFLLQEKNDDWRQSWAPLDQGLFLFCIYIHKAQDTVFELLLQLQNAIFKFKFSVITFQPLHGQTKGSALLIYLCYVLVKKIDPVFFKSFKINVTIFTSPGD